MKMKRLTFIGICCFLSCTLLAQSQETKKEIIAALERSIEVNFSGDSVLYYSTTPADYVVVDPAGKVLNRDAVWQVTKNFFPVKALIKIVSVKTHGDVAWVVYYWSFTPDREGKYEEGVNFVDGDATGFNHVSTIVGVKRSDNWEIVYWQYSNLPDN